MREHLEYFIIRALHALVGVMPDTVVHACGTLAGWTFYVLDRKHRRVAEANVAAAFPARPVGERRAIVRGAFAHFGRLFFELLRFSTLSPTAMLARIDFEGEDVARQAYAQGKGVIFYTGHFGYWELNGIAHALRFEPFSVVARTLDNARLNALLERIRRCTGNSVIYRQGTVWRIMRTLRAKHGVAMLIDQHVEGADAVHVEFFDRSASTTPALAALALRTGAPVVPVFALPNGIGRYRMIYERPVAPPSADSENAIREFTQRCTDVLEMYVRRHPDLWLWMHRRWRDNDKPNART